ncbi:MAG: signal recognition particle protein, partial [Myxococcota bacterium]
GAGKTTTTVKLALHLQRQGRRPLLVAADLSRPGAVQQLQTLGRQTNIPVYTQADLTPPRLCEQGVRYAREHGRDLVLLDTAGRLTVDDALMGELQEIQALANADTRLLVLDAMIGQAAVQTAREFDKRLNLDGFILTKLDGDARGGAALSIRETTGKPIRFVGTGEGPEALETFRPEGLAGRILGMGDVVGLSQEFARHVDEKQAEEDARRLLQGRFTLQDFLAQLRLLKKMGPLRGIMERLPGMQDLLGTNTNLDESGFKHIEAIILSMTPAERRQSALCRQKSRLQRIARGCGRPVKEVRDLLGRFEAMQNVVTNMGRQQGLWSRLTGGVGQAMGAPRIPGSPTLPGAAFPPPDQSPPGGSASQGHGADIPRARKQDKKRKRKLQAKARKHNRKKR